MASRYRPETPINGALRLGIEFYFHRPKSHYRTGKYSHILKEDIPVEHTKTPDLDNLIKFVSDSFNGVFYKDDSQIVEIKARKNYCTHIEQARTEIMIDEI